MTHKDLGNRGEEIALHWLLAKNHRIIAQNFRYQKGEIDLISFASDGTLCFTEVKTSRTQLLASLWVNHKKQKQLHKTAYFFLNQTKEHFNACRFDVIAIQIAIGKFQINYFPNAFVPYL